MFHVEITADGVIEHFQWMTITENINELISELLKSPLFINKNITALKVAKYNPESSKFDVYEYDDEGLKNFKKD